MYIDAVSDDLNAMDVFDTTEKVVSWNGREVEELDRNGSDACLQALSVRHESRGSLSHRKEGIKPMMAKAPDEGEVDITVGADTKGDLKVEIELKFKWGGSGEKNNDSGSGGAAEAKDPPDSGDRDFDRD